MQLSFDEDDEQHYREVQHELLDEIFEALQADGHTPDDADEIASSIRVFLDWRWNYSSGQLDDWSLHDVDEFLFDWLPRKYSAPPAAGAAMCSAVADFFVHMGARDRLVGGVDRAAVLVARSHELTDAVVDAMADPANFGMAKAMFSMPMSDPDGNPLADIGELIESGLDPDSAEFQAAIQQRLDEFNALPFEQRAAITDPSLGGAVPPNRRIKLPLVNVPPTDDELAAGIAESRLVTMVDALVTHIGTGGIAVTQAGNLRLADARTMVEVLGTDDTVDRVRPWDGEPEPIRSSTDLPQLTLVFDAAEAAGAFERLKTKVKVVPDWFESSTIERAQAVIDGLLDLGPVSSTQRFQFFWEIASTIEDGIPHWLSMALPSDSEIDVDAVVDQAVNVVDDTVPGRPALIRDPDSLRSHVDRIVCDALDVLDFAGVVRWEHRRPLTGPYGFQRQTGGSFRLTALGRHTMVDRIRAAGYDFPSLTDLADGTAADVVNVVITTDTEAADVVARWRPGATTAERATELVAFAMDADEPLQRLAAMDVLNELDPVSDVEPVVRQMLDSDCAGHAATYLLQHDLASPDEIEQFFDVGPLVDVMTTLLDDPAVLATLFTESVGDAGADLLEEMWRHERPETIEILEALGRHLTDKQLAKAARKAAIKHRSWMANRGH